MTSSGIKQLIETLLKHMRISFESVEVSEADGRERFLIKTPESHLLIGAKGANLFALNHIVKKMTTPAGERKGSPMRISEEEVRANKHEKQFFVDVNGYQEAAVENIKTMARVMGERARSFKTNVELEPMSSYERMVVHSFFQETKDLKTESVGDGERRRVVIKYVETNN